MYNARKTLTGLIGGATLLGASYLASPDSFSVARPAYAATTSARQEQDNKRNPFVVLLADILAPLAALGLGTQIYGLYKHNSGKKKPSDGVPIESADFQRFRKRYERVQSWREISDTLRGKNG